MIIMLYFYLKILNRLLSILVLAVIVSSVFSISAAYAAPDAPQNPRPDGFPSTTSITISWDAPLAGEDPTGYTIEGALEDPENPGTFGAFNTLVADTGNVTTYTITGLGAGSFYDLRVTAFNDTGSSSPTYNFGAGTQFEAGHDFSDEYQDFSKGTYSGALPLAERTDATTEWYLIFDNLGVDYAVTGLDDNVYPNGVTIYADFSATTTGLLDNDVIFTDSLTTGTVGVIDCVDDATCELSDLTQAISYPGATTVDFDYEQETEFTEGAEFKSGQQFVQGQSFTDAMDFSGGAMTFDDKTQFTEIQNFDEAGTFSPVLADLVGSGGTTTEWADIFADIGAGVVSISGLDNAGASADYVTGKTIYADFSAVTAGDAFNDITFTDNNLGSGHTDGVIDCDTADACELSDLTVPVSYDAGAVVSFDYVIHQDFTGEDIYFKPGQDFPPGQDFAAVMDFSGGAMTFSDGVAFANAQNFAGQTSFNHENINFGSNSTFDTTMTFGDKADFSIGTQNFVGTNAFGDNSIFAPSQEFPTTQTFDGSNTFGAGTKFANLQDFSTAGTATSNAITINGGLAFEAVSTIDKVLAEAIAAGFTGAANTGNFESGTITVIYSGSTLVGDTYEEYAFTDEDLDGIIDAGELSNANHDATTDFGASPGTVTFEQYDVQDFDLGTQTFGNSMKFNANQKFSNHVQTFGTGTTFNGNADFNAGQTFTTGTTFDDGQEFAAVTPGLESTAFAATGITFGDEEPIVFTDNDLTFGAAATFPKNQEFSTVLSASNTLTVTDGTVSTLDAILTKATDLVAFDGTNDVGVAFTTGTITATFTNIGEGEDLVQTYLFTDAGVVGTIEAGELTDPNSELSAVTFAGGIGTITFEQRIDHDFSAADMNFKEGTAFHAGETFGEHVDFEGAITFPEGVDMPTGAEFAAQTFADGATPEFDTFSTFADNTIFSDDDIDFSTNAHFEGDTTFGNTSTHTFGEGTVFDGAIDMGDGAHVFDGDSIDFGPASDLSGAVQDFAGGVTATIPQFGEGTTFIDTQPLPAGSVLSTGILLETVACGTDTSADTCIPTSDDAILTKGEIITPGVTLPAVKNTISADDTTVSIDGLGVSVDFTSVTTDGNLSVEIQDPDDTVAATGATLAGDGSGALEFAASGNNITTVSSVIDFDLTGTTASSGSMTIVLPYDESAAIAAGFTEDNLKVSHFVNGIWVVENDCTVDTINNEITCNNVQSIE